MPEKHLVIDTDEDVMSQLMFGASGIFNELYPSQRQWAVAMELLAIYLRIHVVENDMSGVGDTLGEADSEELRERAARLRSLLS